MLRQRTPLSIALFSAQWQHVPPQIRIRATFSAHVQSIRFLTRLHHSLQDSLDRLQQGQDLTEVKSAFLQEFSQLALTEGMGPLFPKAALAGGGGIEDIPSLKPSRLGLIFDTNIRSAYGFAAYAYQRQRLNDYPAARFFRHPGAKQKRPLHEANENVVHLFEDLDFWLYMNNREIGGFEVPWPPYGYNSWMDREPIPRLQALSMGLIHEDYTAPPIADIGFNDRISVPVSHVPMHILKPLRRALGKAVTHSRGHLIFHPEHLHIPAKRQHRRVQSVLAYDRNYESAPDETVHYLN